MEAVRKLTVELGRVRGEVDVEEAVVLLGRDVVESLQRLHGVGRRDLLEEALQLLLGPQAADAVELGLRPNYGGDGGKFLSTYPARNVLVPTPGKERIEHIFALIVEDCRVI